MPSNQQGWNYLQEPSLPAAGTDIDQQTYCEPAVVALYSRSNDLQPAEAAALAHVRAHFKEMDVLDVGVGAGRTAVHFAPAARSYLGVDYAEPMIAACRQRLPGVRFRVGDARSMDFAADESFDVVLFSFNGLDHLTEEDRERFFRETLRVLRPGGFLIFSSHNGNFIASLIERFRFRISRSLRVTARSLWHAIRFRLGNPRIHSRWSNYRGRVVDGLHNFRSASIYYIRPDLQLDDLMRLGMEEIVCAGNSESELMPADGASMRRWTYPWVYYVCRKPGN